jgi:hypothetical protein
MQAVAAQLVLAVLLPRLVGEQGLIPQQAQMEAEEVLDIWPQVLLVHPV